MARVSNSLMVYPLLFPAGLAARTIRANRASSSALAGRKPDTGPAGGIRAPKQKPVQPRLGRVCPRFSWICIAPASCRSNRREIPSYWGRRVLAMRRRKHPSQLFCCSFTRTPMNTCPLSNDIYYSLYTIPLTNTPTYSFSPKKAPTPVFIPLPKPLHTTISFTTYTPIHIITTFTPLKPHTKSIPHNSPKSFAHSRSWALSTSPPLHHKLTIAPSALLIPTKHTYPHHSPPSLSPT